MTEPSKNLPKIDFAALNAALLQQIKQLLEEWLPDGKVVGNEFVSPSVWRTEKTASLKVSISGSSVGKWADFGGDERGNDLISLYAAIHGMSSGAAAVELAHRHGLEAVANVVAPRPSDMPAAPPPPPKPPPAPAQREREKWRTQLPVPPHAPTPTFWHEYRKPEDIVRSWAYRVDGQLLGHVVRFKTSDGGKEPLPYTWCVSERDGGAKWHWRQFDEPRPLYYPGGTHPSGRTVIVVEGEWKAEVLQACLEAGAPNVYCVVSWPGGSKAWRKASWQWIQQASTVLLWPDCDAKRVLLTKAERDQCGDDEVARAIAQTGKPLLPPEKQPGMSAMLGIGALLRDDHACIVSMLPIPEPLEVPDGWDARDAIEVDGWDFARVLAFFGRAQPLIAPASAPAPVAAEDADPAKKIDRPADAEEDDGRRPWWLRPYWDSDKGRWLVSRKLVIAALINDEALNGILGLDLLSNNIVARKPWPWQHGKAGPITGAVDLLLGRYLSLTYGLPSISRAHLMEAIETVSHETPFHPVRDYLQGLVLDPAKDRIIDKWLVHVIRESPDTLPKPVFDYLVLVGRFWLLGMVHRVMEPGCKFDYCPVLEGPGGLGKSTLVEVLASSAYFSDTHFDVSRGKEGQEQVQGLWLYEIAELANFGKSEINIIKAFISAKVDRYRPSYGRVVEAYARQCVLAGTTNEKTYLRDRTGNRRFWPVPVKQRIRMAWLTNNRDQLFAEAFDLYLQGVPYTPTPEQEDELFAPMQESRLVETAVLSELLHVLTRMPVATGIGSIVNGLTEFVTISQLTTSLGVDAAKSNAALESQIRSWMEHEGWERRKKMINGVRAWGYERPTDWPPQEPDEGAKTTNAPGAEQPAAFHGDADDAPF